jgi:lipoate-protein ligase A
MQWKVLDTGRNSGEKNMALDIEMLSALDQETCPILHLYDWEGDCATYGHFIKPEQFLNLEGVNEKGLHLAKRPTGGGIVFHMWDFSFSILVPSKCSLFSTNTLQNYGLVNQLVLQVVKDFLDAQEDLTLIPEDAPSLDISCERFCMARPTKYDVVLYGKKIAGAAQRQTKQGFLHQGMITLKLPDTDYLQKVLINGATVQNAMMQNTYPLLPNHATLIDLQDARNHLKHLMKRYL